MFVDKNEDCESLFVVVIVVSAIAVVLFIAGVVLLIFYIRLRSLAY